MELGIIIQLMNLYTVVYIQFIYSYPLIPFQCTVLAFALLLSPWTVLLSNYVVNSVTIACVRDYSCVQTLLSYGQYTVQKRDFSNWGGQELLLGGGSAPLPHAGYAPDLISTGTVFEENPNYFKLNIFIELFYKLIFYFIN